MLNPKTDLNIPLIEPANGTSDPMTAEWTASANLGYFKGHFPGNPILPAVAIIDVSIEILRRALRLEELAVKSIKSCKFMHPILPDTSNEIIFRRTSENEWQFDWKPRVAEEPRGSLAHLTLVL